MHKKLTWMRVKYGRRAMERAVNIIIILCFIVCLIDASRLYSSSADMHGNIVDFV